MQRKGFAKYFCASMRLTRHSIDSSRNGKRIQIEAGPFVEFLEEVLAPLNRFIVKLPKDYGARPISAGYVAQVAKKLDPRNCHHKLHRKPRFSLTLNRRVRIAHLRDGQRQMSEIFTAEHLKIHLEVPVAFIPLVLATPRLLPGETDDDYFRLFDMMLNELLPETDMEWLWTIELAWLWFEIYRYRRWKNAIILINRAAAVEKALSKTNPAAQGIGVTPGIRAQARLESQALRANPKDRALNARLQEYGYDSDAINASAFVDGMMSLTMIEKFLASARQQASTMLREAALRRGFVRRATQADWRFQDEERARKASDGAQTGKPAEVTQSS
jgi:hypothetical protein